MMSIDHLPHKPGCCAPSQEQAARRITACDEAAMPSDEAANESAPASELPGEALSRMTLLAGGAFLMGTDDEEGSPADGEGPVREVTLDPFWIDRTPVTNDTFAKFVQATGYVTEAEEFGWSFVFWAHIPEALRQRLVEDTVRDAPWWGKVRGAQWSRPEGPFSNLDRRAHHPVVHVSWHDARAFCAWSGQRLPTEAEWEYAARGGLVQKRYPWGDKLRPDGEHRCNIWQGEFPYRDTADDGYAGTCPVDAFPANGYGLYSIAGNTWEWCADWWSPDFHRTEDGTNPLGPPAGQARVMRGGSFLCHKSYCNRYRVAARTSNSPDSSTANIGFRCAKSV